ncbi:hypothetical protein L7F22_037474 [Adiantum nelumboides]|nr:hypothetical protein [Adiantum nelumboides]
MYPLPFLCRFTPLAVLLLSLQCYVSTGQPENTPFVWHLNQSFPIQASSPAFPQPQPDSLIFPFFPEVQQISNSTTSLNASVFIFPCFFQPSTNSTNGPSLSSTIFALCMTGSVAPYAQGSTSSSLDGYPAVIWRANRLTPAHGETISLLLQEDGDLVLRGLSNNGTVEMVAWRSKTSGMGVTRMELSQQPPNLVLYDADNVTIWQSVDHPTDTLTYGQELEEDIKLVSYGSSIWDSQYRLSINSTTHELTLFFKKHASSQAIPYWNWKLNGTSALNQSSGGSCGPDVFSCNAPMSSPLTLFAAFISSQGFALGDPSIGGNYTAIQGLTSSISEQDLRTTILRLDVDGSLRLLSIKKTWVVLADLFSEDAACLLPQVCGTYGVCVGPNKQCKCPTSTTNPQMSSFAPSDLNDPSRGCVLASPLPACTNSTAIANAGLFCA